MSLLMGCSGPCLKGDCSTDTRDTVPMPSYREPAVAGLFYPANPAALRQAVAGYLEGGPAPGGSAPKVLIVPHAGYAYSGPVAAAAYRCLGRARDQVRRVVLLGPAHRVRLEGLAVPSVDGFVTPLGEIAIDHDARDQVCELSGVQVSDKAHAQEHSLEVQLPFLQTALAGFRLLPLVVGRADPRAVAAVIDRLWGGAETLLVVSTDLSHFHPYEKARQIDARTCRQILDRSTSLTGEEACGAVAVNGLMASDRVRALDIEQLDLRNSGDTAGDRSQVVGYGAFILH